MATERRKDDYSRASDLERGIKGAIKNGVGTIASRSIIILGLPLLTATTGLGGYAVKLTLDGIARDNKEVVSAVGDVKALVTQLGADMTEARKDITQLQITSAVLKEKTGDSPSDELRHARR